MAGAQITTDFARFEPAAARLTPYAVVYRYPGHLPEPTTTLVAEVLQAAREILVFVLDRLPPVVQP